MGASVEAMKRPARGLITTFVVRLSASSALLFSGCATERSHRTARPALPWRPTPGSSRLLRPTRTGTRRWLSPRQRPTGPPRPSRRLEGDRRGEKPDTRQEDLNVPVPSPSLIPPPPGEYPIDLSTALRLAEAENPTIAAARARIIESLALQTQARAILLPSLNAGTNFHLHTGNLQRSSGRILNLTEQSLYVGGGALAFAAGTVEVPAVNILGTLTEAWFEPLAAHQRVIGTSFTALATANEILLDVALLHLELLANQEILDAPAPDRAPEPRPCGDRQRLRGRRVNGEPQTPIAHRPTGSCAGPPSSAPRRPSRSPRPGWPTGSISIPPIRLRPEGGALVPDRPGRAGHPQLRPHPVCPASEARSGRPKRRSLAGRGPVPRGARTPLAPHGLAGVQRRRLWGREQRRPSLDGSFRGPFRLRRAGFLDAHEPGCRQSLAPEPPLCEPR